MLSKEEVQASTFLDKTYTILNSSEEGSLEKASESKVGYGADDLILTDKQITVIKLLEEASKQCHEDSADLFSRWKITYFQNAVLQNNLQRMTKLSPQKLYQILQVSENLQLLTSRRFKTLKELSAYRILVTADFPLPKSLNDAQINAIHALQSIAGKPLTPLHLRTCFESMLTNLSWFKPLHISKYIGGLKIVWEASQYHAVVAPNPLQDWVQLFFNHRGFRESLSTVATDKKQSAEVLYNILQYPEGVDLFKLYKVKNADDLQAYQRLFSQKIETVEIYLNKAQIEAINFLPFIPLSQECFTKCMDDILKYNSNIEKYYSTNIPINIQHLANKVNVNNIAEMLEDEVGFRLLKEKIIDTPDKLLAYCFLLQQKIVTSGFLTQQQAQFILLLEKLNAKTTLIDKLGCLVDTLTTSGFPYNLSVMASQSELLEEDILNIILQEQAWLDFLKERNLFMIAYSYPATEKDLAKAYLLLLMAGNPPSILNTTQTELILRPEIMHYNSREIYQKIIDNEKFIAALKTNAALKALAFHQTNAEIDFCRLSSSPYLNQMLEFVNTVEDVKYVINFCQSLQDLEKKLPEFYQREENEAGKAAMSLLCELYNLVAKYFQDTKWDAQTLDIFKTEVGAKINEEGYAVLGVHRGVLGVVNTIATHLRIWGGEQNTTLFQTASSRVLQRFNQGKEWQQSQNLEEKNDELVADVSSGLEKASPSTPHLDVNSPHKTKEEDRSKCLIM